jgi:hypothetical protein
MDIIKDAEEFLLSILPHNTEDVVKPKDPKTLSVKELKEAIRDNALNSQAVGLSEKSEFVKVLADFYASRGFTY